MEKQELENGKDLRELAGIHLEVGEAEKVTNQQLFNHLRDEGYDIEHADSEIENYFSEKDTGLKQRYELEKNGESYELHIEKQRGRMKDYWFTE